MATLEYFTVVGDFLAIVGDTTADVDLNPDTVAMTGKVTFTPRLNSGDALLAKTLSPRPAVVLPAKIVAKIESDGQLKYNGNVGVRLVAKTAVLELESPLYYDVKFEDVSVNGSRVSLTGYTFQAPTSDVTINLVDVARVPGVPGVGIQRGAPGDPVDDVQLNGDGDLVFYVDGDPIGEPVEIPGGGVADGSLTVPKFNPSAIATQADANDVGFVPSDNDLVTSAAMSSSVTGVYTALDTAKQDKDTDLTAIAAITPSNDDFVQRKAGAWTNRTVAQVKTDLGTATDDAATLASATGRAIAFAIALG